MRNRRRLWQEYPESFLSIISKFESSRNDQRYSLIHKEASATRFAFYRFQEAIRFADKEGDTDVASAARIIREISIQILPGRAKPNQLVELIFHLDNILTEPVQDTFDISQNEIEQALLKKHGKEDE